MAARNVQGISEVEGAVSDADAALLRELGAAAQSVLLMKAELNEDMHSQLNAIAVQAEKAAVHMQKASEAYIKQVEAKISCTQKFHDMEFEIEEKQYIRKERMVTLMNKEADAWERITKAKKDAVAAGVEEAAVLSSSSSVSSSSSSASSEDESGFETESDEEQAMDEGEEQNLSSSSFPGKRPYYSHLLSLCKVPTTMDELGTLFINGPSSPLQEELNSLRNTNYEEGMLKRLDSFSNPQNKHSRNSKLQSTLRVAHYCSLIFWTLAGRYLSREARAEIMGDGFDMQHATPFHDLSQTTWCNVDEKLFDLPIDQDNIPAAVSVDDKLVEAVNRSGR